MPAPSASARAVAGKVLRVLPPRARGVAFRRLAPLLRLGGTDAGLATLVVLCEPVDLPRLASTLESVRHDAHAYREVLVAPVGAAYAGAREVVATLTDPRVRLLPARPTWQEAASAGVDAASGRFLQLLRACDPRLPDALADLVRSVTASGSALATGAIEQRGRAALWLERMTAAAHGAPAQGIAPGDRPALAGDLGLGNKLFRTDAWREAGRLGAHDGWLLSPTLAAHLARVGRVDVLDRPVQEHVGGHGVRPFGALPSALPGLEEWSTRAEHVERALAGTPLAPGWHAHVLDVALPGFLLDAERAGEEEWQRLRALVARHSGHAPDDDLDVESRVLLWLAREDRRVDVEAMAVQVDDLAGDVPTHAEDGEVVGDWSALPDDVPAAVRRLTARETPLVASVVRLREIGDATEVDLFVRVDHVDLGDDAVLEVVAPDGTRLPAAPDPAATRWAGSRFHRALAATATVPADTSSLHLRVTANGLTRSGDVALADPHARPSDPDRRVVVTDLGLDGDRLVVDVTGPGSLRLVDDRERVVGSVEEGRLALRDRLFGRERWLPTGHYRLVTDGGTPVADDRLLGRLPLEQVGIRHRLRAAIGPAGGLLLHLGPPLADDEQGAFAQERLVAAHTADRGDPDPRVVYFESYAGRSATDSPRAIHDELVARGLGHTTYWGVSDHAQWTPPGARPVLLRSREWYAVLARAGGLVVNTDVEAWFRRRPGQVLLQTFHGYPSKGMGLVQWRAAQLPESRIATLRARGVDTWSAIVTPTPEMTRHYREQYGYTGPAFERGYPRDDDLVAPDAGRRRQEVRELLGIGERTAVLYAPTWREHLATRARRADMADFLDVERAARELGDGHVLLLRGHRFHHRRDVDADPRVLDVTDHPEVNDLLLAADVAVLDYSSLRFDFALTGRPMVFLVPDLADYGTGTRSFLFPFEDSAPGPLVDDTDGVVEQVRDVAALRSRWADRIADFNATYHPFQDGGSTARVVDGLLALLAETTA